MVAREDINKLIEATDMYALVSPYVKLIKSGSGYKGLCPFHNEKTPSFSVSQEKHLAHCFSCGKGGNPIQFLMDIKNISFMEAVKELAKINHMELNIDDPNAKIEEERKKYYDLNLLAYNLFTRNLFMTNEGKKALAYLEGRGLDEETIKTFGIGLAPKDGKMLYNLLKESNFLELDMVDVGLVKNVNDNYVDFFVNRIMYPIRNERGKIIGFSGRDYTGSSEAKYMNTIESPIFKKNLVLYNLDLAIPAISKNNRIILHEGYMDVIATYRSGLHEVVCSMGTALTTGQIKQISRFTKNVILSFDSDSAGIKATYRAAELFIKEGFNVNVLKIDKTKDSDEFVKKYGLKTYYDYFNSHITTFIDYVYNDIINNLNVNDIFNLENSKKNLFKYLNLYHSNIVLEKYLNLFSQKIGVSLNALLNDYNKLNNNLNYEPEPIIPNIPKKNKEEIYLYELRIFEYAKISKNKALEIDSKLEKGNNFVGFKPINERLWQELMNYYNIYDEFNEEDFITLLQSKNLYDDYYHMIEDNEKYKEKLDLPYSEIDLEECLNKLVSNSNKNKLNNLQKTIVEQSDLELKKELTIKKFQMRKKYERN